MKKSLKIFWGIPEDELIEHKFKVESGVFRISAQEIVIQLQNIIEFLIGHLSFQYNEIYKPCYIYN